MSAEEQARRSRRRAVARTHHPDLGGDAEAFVDAMGLLAAAPHRAPSPQVVVMLRTTRRRQLSRATRRGAHRLASRLRRRLPRSVPGARRYARL